MSTSYHNQVRVGLIDLVQADATIMGKINGNIYARSLADMMDPSDIENWDWPLITFRVSGSAATTVFTTPHRVSLTIQCWSSKDLDEAWDIADNLKAVLDSQRVVVDGTVMRFEVTNAGQEAFDPTSTLYYVIQQYKCILLSAS